MRPTRPHLRGFTLVELLVALAILTLLTLLSWRSLDGMARAQGQLRQRSDELLTLQTALAQWSADLDALAFVSPLRPGSTESPRALAWNGQVMRMTRYNATTPASGLQVVAWVRREIAGGGVWLRWQSGVLHTQGELQLAWQQAGRWATSPGDIEKRNEVQIAPLSQWEIFYFRDDAWSHPLSSDTLDQGNAPDGAPQSPSRSGIPDGVRLVLTLPPGHALSGRLTRDWLRPTVGGRKS